MRRRDDPSDGRRGGGATTPRDDDAGGRRGGDPPTLRRRALLGTLAATGATSLAGCSGGGDGTPTPNTPSPTPACADSSYDDEGSLSFGFGFRSFDGNLYDSTLRVIHVRSPVCRYEEQACGKPETESVVFESSYRLRDDWQYEIVQASATPDVDVYRIEFAVTAAETADGTGTGGGDGTPTGDTRTVQRRGVEQAARSLVDGEWDFFICNPGQRRFGGLVTEAGEVQLRPVGPDDL